jgi:peptidyl-prolyl cis-trans isomerase D
VVYASEIKSFKQEHERRVSRILIEASRDHDEAFRKAAKEKAEALLARIRKGEDFAELAKASSEDRITAAKGGDRGWSPRGFVSAPGNDPFGDVAFAMKKIGDVSEVVETLDGYEIIKLTGLKEEKQKTFEEVKADIIGRRHYLMVGKFWDRFFAGLQAKAEIVWSQAELARKEEREKTEREASLNAERTRLLGGDISGR